MTDSPRPLVAGNWKMNGLGGDGLALAADLARRAASAKGEEAPACDLLVCPPATLLWRVAEALGQSPIAVGGQDCHANAEGAHTGDISAEMLKDAGASHAIVGHSERRAGHSETDALVRAKAEAALGAGLCAIICIGETEAQYGAGETLGVLERQLAGSLPKGPAAAEVVVAYEPIWAIGTGLTPSLDEIAAVHAHIRGILGGASAEGGVMRILYGGSVNAANAAEILALEEVNGALVGGASLHADDFWTIARSCS
ncbi:MAG: triose-phosphate isomerase [Alphaproteobacteria bacterium]|nr:MAG: triose-phosphate isomerase [Alphaproteobacteria bacterium]